LYNSCDFSSAAFGARQTIGRFFFKVQMNIFQRIGFAAELAAKAITQGRTAFNLLPTWQDKSPDYPLVNYENNVRFGYRKNELIFSCIDKKVNCLSNARLEVYDMKTGSALPSHDLQKLLDRPNDFFTGFDTRRWIMASLDLAAHAYLEKVRSGYNRVVELWPLRPDWMRPVKSAENFIDRYEYCVPGMNPLPMDPKNVLDFVIHDPLNLLQGWSPVSVASRVGDLDNSTTDYLKLFFQHGGVPPGFLKIKGRKLRDEQEAEEIRKKWMKRYGGFENWLAPVVMDEDADYQDIGQKFKDMGFDVLDARSEARICMVLGVPPILVGAKVGLDRSTFANYAEAKDSFWDETIEPQCVRIADEFNMDLSIEFGSNIGIRWDFSEVSAVQARKSKKWDVANRSWQSGLALLNEAREIVDLQRLNEGDIRNVSGMAVETPATYATQVKREGKAEAPHKVERDAAESKLMLGAYRFFQQQKERVKDNAAG
jgi:HK97 family phage portal protein